MVLDGDYVPGQDLIGDYIHRCQVYVFPRRIRVREFFVNFDPLNSGRCTRVQFGRALNTVGVKFADLEIEELADHFTESGPNVRKPQVVSYAAFCKAVDEVFATDTSLGSTLDRNSKLQEETFRMSLTSFTPNVVEDEELMDHLLHRLAALCKSRGFVWKHQFFDFDRGDSASPSRINKRRSGKCSIDQFKRFFPFKKEFTESEIDLITQRYTTEAGDSVNFQAIHNDISEVVSPEPPPFPTSDLILKPDPTEWSHQILNPVKKVQSKVVERRIRLCEYFADFDVLRKGVCTPGQLKTVFTITNLSKEINPADFDELCKTYCREDGMFVYALFCRDVDAAFSIPGLEKDPLAMTPLPDATTTAAGRRNRMTLTPHRKRAIDKLEDAIRSRISKRRILMKPMFLDMDKANRGVVTRGQFHRVMGMLGFELVPEDITLLAGYYCDRGNHNEFNYVDFIKACDPPDESEEIAMGQLNSPYQDAAPSKYFATGMKVHPLERALSSGSLVY